jgi:glycosyltransferase involved in cell wall biosynthesis
VNPLLTCLIPTAGRESLARCLRSLQLQQWRGLEVLVIGDTHDGPLPQTEATVRSFGPRFRYLAHDAGHHCFGHCALNYGLEQAQGEYVHCQDDDDIYANGALYTIRQTIRRLRQPRPLLFRFRSYFGHDYWAQQGLVREGLIGGHCLVAPNLPGKLGRFTCRYQGDFDWIRSTLDGYPDGPEPLWLEDIICLARPKAEQDWTQQRRKVTA